VHVSSIAHRRHTGIAVTAATAAPGVLAVTSNATALAATSDAAVTAFTEYDENIEFNHVIDDGGWGAGGDEVMGESSGRSLLSSQHNNTITAHAAITTRVLQDQGGYDSNIMDVFTPPPTGAVKGNLPPGFVRILDNIKLCMLSRLDVNSLAANIYAFGKSTVKGMIDDIVEARDSLLLYAEQADPICWDMLDDAIPNRLSSKTKKHEICKYLVDMWDIFKYLLSKKDLSTVARGNQIYKCLPMMEKLEGKVMLLKEHAEEVNQNSKSLKIPDKMMNCNHFESGSFNFKVDNKLYPSCPKCNHILLNQPKENKDITKSNNKLQAKYKKNKKKLDNFLLYGDSPLRKDGKELGKIDPPKLKDLIIMCKCWRNKHASYVGWLICALLCKDSMSGKGYKAGQCPACICSCTFVFTFK
jgi:hypothetical protein